MYIYVPCLRLCNLCCMITLLAEGAATSKFGYKSNSSASGEDITRNFIVTSLHSNATSGFELCNGGKSCPSRESFWSEIVEEENKEISKIIMDFCLTPFYNTPWIISLE